MAQLNTTNYPVTRLSHVTGLDASGNVRHGTASTVHVKDFGAVGNGSTDDTAALKSALDSVMASGKTLVFGEGTYLVTGTISTIAETASVNLHIQCAGLVTINVSASATAFDYLIYCYSTAANNASITGGILRIDCNDKCGTGIYIRHGGASQSGTVNIETPVTVLDCKQNNAAQVNENYGIAVIGDYARVYMNQTVVRNVSRTNTTGGGCKGIAISGFSGEVVLEQPTVESVLCPTGSSEADGIATFAKSPGAETLRTPGRVTINQPYFIDCKGRSFKSQCSDTTIIRPRVWRQSVVAEAQCVEFDFQRANGLVIEPQYDYRLNGAVSPLGSSHSCVTFRHELTDAPMNSKSVGGCIRTEAVLPHYCIFANGTGAAYGEVEIDGLRIVPIGSFATTAFDRAIVEFRADHLVAKTGKTMIRVNDVAGPMNCYGIGYTNYVSGDVSAKLNVEVTNLRNTLSTITSATLPFSAISGGGITQVDTFLFRNNHGFRDLLSGLTFNFNKLVVGCVFTVIIEGVTATNAPPWGATGYATIECLSDYFAVTDKTVRVTKGSGAGVWFTQDGGTTWGTTA